MRIFHYISISMCVLLLILVWYNNISDYQIIKGKIFGTYYTIKIRIEKPIKELDRQIKAELEKINKEMSVFETSSEISQINNTAQGIEIKLSSDMKQVLLAANQVYNQSEGYFDPSLGKLIDLWGFGAGKKTSPSDKEISEALQSSGFNKLIFSKDFD